MLLRFIDGTAWSKVDRSLKMSIWFFYLNSSLVAVVSLAQHAQRLAVSFLNKDFRHPRKTNEEVKKSAESWSWSRPMLRLE